MKSAAVDGSLGCGRVPPRTDRHSPAPAWRRGASCRLERPHGGGHGGALLAAVRSRRPPWTPRELARAVSVSSSSGAGDGHSTVEPSGERVEDLLQEALSQSAQSLSSVADDGDPADPKAVLSLLLEVGVNDFRAQELSERVSRGELSLRPTTARRMVAKLREMGLKDSSVRKIVGDCPELLAQEAEAMPPKFEFLLAVGVRGSALPSLLERTPAMLLMPIFQLGEVYQYLRSLELQAAILPLMLERFPSLFLSPAEERLVPRVRWLKQEVGLAGRPLARVLEERPQLLIHSIEHMSARVDALRSFGLASEDIRHIVEQLPSVLVLDPDTQLRPTLAFLEGQGLDSEALRTLVTQEPAVLQVNFSSDAEKKKVAHLTEVMGRDFQDLAKCPEYITARLSKVAPRAAFLCHRGRDVRSIPLREVVRGTDREWASQVAGVPAAEFFKFKEDYMVAQAEAEFDSGEWDFYYKSSMP